MFQFEKLKDQSKNNIVNSTQTCQAHSKKRNFEAVLKIEEKVTKELVLPEVCRRIELVRQSQTLQDGIKAQTWWILLMQKNGTISLVIGSLISFSVLVQPNILAVPSPGTCGYGGISEYCGSNM